MKKFIIMDGPYIQNSKDKTLHYIIEVLLVMIIYRLLNEGIVPYFKGSISFMEIFLPFLIVCASILLFYGFFYIGKLFLKFKYKTEECIIEGMIFGLVFPLHASILIMCISIFATVIARRFYETEKVNPLSIGLVTLLLFLKWSNFNNDLLLNINFYLCLVSILFLTYKKSLKWRIPIYFIGTYFIMTIFSSIMLGYIITFEITNLLFFSIFIVSNKKTTPITNSGQIIFSLSLAIFTFFGSYFMTSIFAMLLSSLLLNSMTSLFDYFGNYYGLKYCNEFEIL